MSYLNYRLLAEDAAAEFAACSITWSDASGWFA
jgi:hypothetical protein